MQRTLVMMALAGLLFAGFGATAHAADWSLKGRFTDSCSCDAACPCVFASPPTKGFCEGNALVEVKKGAYGDVNLDGVSAVVTYHMGPDGAWNEFYVTDAASNKQVKAMTHLLPAAFEFLGGGEIKTVATAPIRVDRSESYVEFSVPASSSRIEKVLNAGGQPITMEGLPAKGFPGPAFHEYTLYRAVELNHEGEKGAFHHSGTNGHTANIDVSGEI